MYESFYSSGKLFQSWLNIYTRSKQKDTLFSEVINDQKGSIHLTSQADKIDIYWTICDWSIAYIVIYMWQLIKTSL